jgi:hypothetical protein
MHEAALCWTGTVAWALPSLHLDHVNERALVSRPPVRNGPLTCFGLKSRFVCFNITCVFPWCLFNYVWMTRSCSGGYGMICKPSLPIPASSQLAKTELGGLPEQKRICQVSEQKALLVIRCRPGMQDSLVKTWDPMRWIYLCGETIEMKVSHLPT